MRKFHKKRKHPPFYAITVVVFLGLVIFIFVFSSANRLGLEAIKNATENFSCRPVSEDYWFLESTYRQPRYYSNSSFEKIIGGSMTFLAKINITNLENVPVKYNITYTFYITAVNGTKRNDIFRINVSVSANSTETTPIYTVSAKGDDATGNYTIITGNMTFIENVTKTNTSFKCF